MIGYEMPTHLVNLDALIQREDFESSGAAAGSYGSQPTFKLSELEQKNHYFGVLRKPDFQRDTNNWSPKMIIDFITSFLDNELIPSIILWISRESNKVFIIDGAHRVSALIAWVNDDYGDGGISKKAFNFKVPAAQAKFHTQTRDLVASSIGSYAELCHVLLNQDQNTNEEKLRRARAMAIRQAPVQIVDGDALVAERSFFKINCTPVLIDDTELDIIRARNKPNAIATRAMIRAGTGHKYWRNFSDGNRDEIEKQAGIAYNLVFGQIVDMGLQSVDVPRAGQPYSQDAFRMVLDMINIFNDVTPAMWREPKVSTKKVSNLLLEDDITGDETITFLKKVVNIGLRVSGSASDYSGSIGLDQAVYSYGSTGKFHPTAMIASYKMAQWLSDTDQLKEFASVRSDYEEFLVRHKHFINDIGHSKGSGMRSLESLLTLHTTLFECFKKGLKSDRKIIDELKKHSQLKNLEELESVEADQEAAPKKSFSKTAQDIALLREILAGRARCPICNSRMPPAFRSRDHIVRKEDGGMGGERQPTVCPSILQYYREELTG